MKSCWFKFKRNNSAGLNTVGQLSQRGGLISLRPLVTHSHPAQQEKGHKMELYSWGAMKGFGDSSVRIYNHRFDSDCSWWFHKKVSVVGWEVQCFAYNVVCTVRKTMLSTRKRECINQ